MNIKNTEYNYFLFLQKNDNMIIPSKPLLVISDKNDSHIKDLHYLRDVDLSVIVEENELWTCGIIKAGKGLNPRNILNGEKENIKKILEFKTRIKMRNVKRGFQGSIQGDVIMKKSDFTIYWRVFKIGNDFIMSTPHLHIDDAELSGMII